MVTLWPTRRLESLVETHRPITYGVVKPGEHDPDGVTFVRGGEITDGRIALGQLRTITREVSDKYKRTLLRGGELLILLVGNPGQVALAPSSLAGANIARQVGLVALGEEVNSEYVVYFLMSPVGLARLGARMKGSVQVVINLADLRTVEVPIPPRPVQDKIASILSAYDDLIENNLRRIEILEEMAQALYREWFLEFRFPDREGAELVDSALGWIPVGWEVKSFSDVAAFVNGFAFKPIHWQATGKPIVKIRELKNGITADTPRYHGEDIAAKYHVTNGCLLFSWSADLDTYLWRGGDALLNQHLFNVIPADGISRPYLYYALRDRMQEFRNLSLGTTMRHIKRSALTHVRFVLAPVSIRAQFEGLVMPMLTLVRNLYDRVTSLGQSRDLLLPRLISGELDVADLDIEIGEAA